MIVKRYCKIFDFYFKMFKINVGYCFDFDIILVYWLVICGNEYFIKKLFD